MLELLAPAGSMEALYAAVQNGANAVYLGCGTFNARQSAKNFTIQSLTEAVRYCHIRGVKVHLTLNTLVSDNEMEEACALIKAAASIGVDAFIVQDLGMVAQCRRIAPHVAVHGSTQMTIHSLAGVQLCAKMGMTRVVLSRELSREEIAYICAHSPIEIEVFAHGALCMCYSGQCLLSAAIGGRSGNRGRCAQPCRQSYGYGRWEPKYPLSLKDNCLVSYLTDLEKMGVASLKLEGRMKRAEYVASVTNVYRKTIDEGRVTKPMMDTLMTAFNREGFTDGYYTGNIGRTMFGTRQETRDDPKWLSAARATYEAVERSLVDISFSMEVTVYGSSLTVVDEEGRTATARGPVPEVAKNLALTADALIARLGKTGGTPYRCVKADVKVEDGLMLSAAAVNSMRRDVLDQLTALRSRVEPTVYQRPLNVHRFSGLKQAPTFTVQVTSLEQITKKLLSMKPDLLYVPLFLLAQNPGICKELTKGADVAAVLPRIIQDPELKGVYKQLKTVYDAGVRSVLVGNLGMIEPVADMGFHVHGDFGLNIYNSLAVHTAGELGCDTLTLSVEMTLPQIRDVSKAVPTEILAYGRMPLMVTENCLMKNRTGACSCKQGAMKLTDKTGADFPVIKDQGTCRSVLLNGKKLYWLDRRAELGGLGLWALRLYFTTENAQEVDRVLRNYETGAAFDPGACTRGLYLRGVE